MMFGVKCQECGEVYDDLEELIIECECECRCLECGSTDLDLEEVTL